MSHRQLHQQIQDEAWLMAGCHLHSRGASLWSVGRFVCGRAGPGKVRLSETVALCSVALFLSPFA